MDTESEIFSAAHLVLKHWHLRDKFNIGNSLLHAKAVMLGSSAQWGESYDAMRSRISVGMSEIELQEATTLAGEFRKLQSGFQAHH